MNGADHGPGQRQRNSPPEDRARQRRRIGCPTHSGRDQGASPPPGPISPTASVNLEYNQGGGWLQGRFTCAALLGATKPVVRPGYSLQQSGVDHPATYPTSAKRARRWASGRRKALTMSQAILVPHGTLDYAEARALGVRPDELTVFSSNINPYGPPPAVLDALRAACRAEIVARYPDRLSLDLRDALAHHHGIDAASILVGNGTADILWLIGLLYLTERRVAILSPTFGEYGNVARLMRATVLDICLPGWQQTDGIYHPAATTLDDTVHALSAAAPDVVFLCNPNNPDGQSCGAAEVARLHDAAPSALWIIDEAYTDFMDQPVTAINAAAMANVLVLRSMTKDFALGGLRLGYVVGDAERIAALQATQPPWNVNAFAHAAGLACLGETDWRRTTLSRLRADCAALQDALRDAGFAPRPTTVAYFLAPVSNATALRNALLPQRMVIRDCTSFGLPDHIRIATGKPEENARLVVAMRGLNRYAAPTTSAAPAVAASSSTDGPASA